MLLLIKLMLAHVIGDFLLLSDRWVEQDENRIPWKRLCLHLLIHGIALGLIIFSPDDWLLIGIILISHFLIDLTKLVLRKIINPSILFGMDQLIHVGIILGLVSVRMDLGVEVDDRQIFQLLLFILLTTVVSSEIVRQVMNRWNPDLEPLMKPDESLKNAGSVIGILERLFIFVFVISQQWAGIGFLIAAKSVFRFNDISRSQDRKLTEYIIIGTLLSFGLGILWGVIYLWINSY